MRMLEKEMRHKMTEHEERHTDNFMRDFGDLLRRYKAVYKSTG
jgi:hypothetical protein